MNNAVKATVVSEVRVCDISRAFGGFVHTANTLHSYCRHLVEARNSASLQQDADSGLVLQQHYYDIQPPDPLCGGLVHTFFTCGRRRENPSLFRKREKVFFCFLIYTRSRLSSCSFERRVFYERKVKI